MGHTNGDGAWTKVLEARDVVGMGRHSLTPLPSFAAPVRILAGDVASFTVILKGGGIAYSPGQSKAAISHSNSDLALYEGSYVSGYHGDMVAKPYLSRSARIWEGTVQYEVASNGHAVGSGVQQYVQRTGLLRYITLSMDRRAPTLYDAEEGECTDDPEFWYIFGSGRKEGCEWFAKHRVPGCGFALVADRGDINGATTTTTVQARCGCACEGFATANA